MSISIRQNDKDALRLTAVAAGHELALDMPAPQGEGPDPHDYFDTALGGCKAMTVLLYARRKGYPLEHVAVNVERDASREREGVYGLSVTLTLQGALDEAQRQDLLAIADRCPIHRLMTQADIEVSTRLG
ncbi:OsmC family protein [Kerstersia gyiorum]|uniref:OsmC family protein n=1 Tax=Kerstersia gyiorum TaxID=206506 RepID=A0A171KWK6_9BURK|nr:OsmC family protein [Kerstersia gyiorum]MCO7635833.1 OsmC family protein [Pseudomonas sp. S 311-6]KAB0544922.1 OsmC family protein [Kerstersia gyiorum]KKO73273.1 OsmC family protein [Kerstersia gyiorum]MCP1632173.1 putative redox protein [Kerstersia gyiorum]MCP1635320.1 putative redox protein [Kerstersia gyiorum]